MSEPTMAGAGPGESDPIDPVAPSATGRPASASPGSGSASIVARLRSVLEAQASLALEEREEDVLRVGVASAVEILGADCGLGAVGGGEADGGTRCGWGEGHRLARHEAEVLFRNLEDGLRPILEGSARRTVLAEPAGGDPRLLDPAGEVPAALQARGIGSVLAQAIGSGAERRGVLVVARSHPAPFDHETALLGEILAHQIAAHLERARRLAQAHRATDRVQEEVETATRDLRSRNQELEALNAVAAAVLPSFDLERQLEVAVRKAVEVTGHAAGAIYLARPEENGDETLTFARGCGDAAYVDCAQALVARRGEGPVGRAWQSGEPVTLADLGADPEVGGCEALAKAGYRGLLAVPLRARGRAIGVLELAATGIRSYTGEDVRLARAVADQVGLGVQNSRLFSDIMRHSLELEGRTEARSREVEAKDRQVRALQDAVEATSHSSGPGPALEAVLGRMVDLAAARAGAIHRVSAGGGPLRLAAGRGLTPEVREALRSVDRAQPLIGRAAESGEVVAATDLQGVGDGPQAALVRAGLRFALALPLRARGQVLGVATMMASEEPLIGQEEKTCLAALGTLAALSLTGAGDGAAPPAATLKGGLPALLVQSQKMETIGTLAGGIAHDFNNIVGAILGCATYVKSLVTHDNPIFRQAERIEQQAARAADLTRQLLAFARGGQYRLEPVDLNGTVAEIVSLLSRSLDRSIALEVHTEPDLPAVEADVAQMKQILLNVAVNAKDALPRGGRITFETNLAHLDEEFARSHPDVRPGDYVQIAVSDTGVGMPPEVLDRVFEPFFTTKPPGEGTGLGLAVVYGIVKNHRGHVSLTSTPHVGTTVRISLPSTGRRCPRREPVSSAVTVPAAPGFVEAITGGPPARDKGAPRAAPAALAPQSGRILVVDDEEAIRQMAQDILELRGYEVVLARDGVEALDLFRQHWGKIALVILDMVMPRLGGLETFRRLRGMDRNIRVLLSTGFSQSETQQRAMKEGAMGVLAKPFTMSELLAWVEKAVRREPAAPTSRPGDR
jgi:signal transduction histidine kinase/CheY-like chemotaxis protein